MTPRRLAVAGAILLGISVVVGIAEVAVRALRGEGVGDHDALASALTFATGASLALAVACLLAAALAWIVKVGVRAAR